MSEYLVRAASHSLIYFSISTNYIFRIFSKIYTYSLDCLELLTRCAIPEGLGLVEGLKGALKVTQTQVTFVGSLMRLHEGLVHEKGLFTVKQGLLVFPDLYVGCSTIGQDALIFDKF